MHAQRRANAAAASNAENPGAAAGSSKGGGLGKGSALGDITNVGNQQQDGKAGPVKARVTRSSAAAAAAPAAAASSSTTGTVPAAASTAVVPRTRRTRTSAAAASGTTAAAAAAAAPALPVSRPATDIDERDVLEPLAVTEYVEILYAHLREQEVTTRIEPDAITLQPHVNERMRAILVDWLVEVHLRFRLVPDTLYLTVYIIDKYLSEAEVTRQSLQLVGVTALLLAAKYEEIYPPEIRDLVYMTDRAYTKEQILEMETEILNKLEFRLTVPTAYCFLLRYLKAAHADRKIVQLSCYVAERMLQEHRMLAHLPSAVASCAIFLARRNLGRNAWSPTLEKYTGYREGDLAACLRDTCELMAATTDLKAVKQKFSSRQFGAVATNEINWTF
jgi:G2/mitotic-specific cyclin-B, other